jgi:hypothetical protein
MGKFCRSAPRARIPILLAYPFESPSTAFSSHQVQSEPPSSCYPTPQSRPDLVYRVGPKRQLLRMGLDSGSLPDCTQRLTVSHNPSLLRSLSLVDQLTFSDIM